MREDQLEQLEKMFPDGFIIIPVCKDGKARLTLNNPNKDKELAGQYLRLAGTLNDKLVELLSEHKLSHIIFQLSTIVNNLEK